MQKNLKIEKKINMQSREHLIDYEYSGWPIFKLTLREILLNLGAKSENGKLSFDNKNPILDVCPKTYEDDGMGYGVNECNIISASGTENIKEIVLFLHNVNDPERQSEILERWDTEEQEIMSQLANHK